MLLRIISSLMLANSMADELGIDLRDIVALEDLLYLLD